MEEVRKELAKKLFKDTIHGDIVLHPVLIAIIDTPHVQRLRYIKKLGGVCYVYPTAVHTCFEHALGCCHLAGKLIQKLKEKQPYLEISNEEILCIQIAALCHNLGVGPFSHVFQDFVIPELNTKWELQEWSVKMFIDLITKNPKIKEKCEEHGLYMEEKHWTLVQGIIKGEGQYSKQYLYQIVNNKWNGIDVCKMDSVTCDSYSMGLSVYKDWMRYIEYALVLGDHICTIVKVAGDLVDLLKIRSLLFRKTKYHKTTRIIEHEMSLALLEAKDKKLFLSNGQLLMMQEVIETENMSAYIKLTDCIIQQILNDPKSEQAQKIWEDIQLRSKVVHVSSKYIGCAHQLSPEESSPTLDYGTSDILSMEAVRESLKKELGSLNAWTDVVMYKNTNPLARDMFYKANNPEKVITITPEELPREMPPNFREVEVRMYSKTTRDELTVEELDELNKAFEKWCKSHGFTSKLLK